MDEPFSTITRRLAPGQSRLDAWTDHDWTNGLQLEALPALRSFEIRTRNTDYRVMVIDGRRGDVLITGGRFFPAPTRVRLNGSTLGGSVLKSRGVYCGFRIELQVGSQVVVTTRVRAVTLGTETASAVH